jgi:hypothetical protein
MYKKIKKNFDFNIIFGTSYGHLKYIDRYLYNRFNIINKLFDELNWIHANPSSKNVVANTKKIYIPTEERDEFFKNLFSMIETNNKLVFIAGKRGSGKTFLQNYFLNIKMPEIENTTWFRVDITKIYHYNIEHLEPINFEDYLYAQIAFVFFRYHKSYNNDKSYGYDKNFVKITKEEINRIFKDIDIADNERDSFIDNIIKVPHYSNNTDGKPFKYKFIKEVSTNILKLLYEKNIKIVLFVDGIDNVSLANNKYRKMREQIGNFLDTYLHKQDKQDKQDKGIHNYISTLIISARKELDIQNYFEELYKKEGQNKFKSAPRLEVKNSANAYIEKLIDKLIEYSNGTLPKVLKDDLEYLIQVIVNKVIKYTGIQQNNLTYYKYYEEKILDGDIREGFFALISTYIFVKVYLSNINNFKHPFESLKDIVESKNQKIISTINSVIVEGFFKCGCFYTVDEDIIKYTPPYKSLAFTNIFNPAFFMNLTYNPLVSLYALKYLMDNKDKNISYDHLLKKCNQFGLCTEKYITYRAIEVLIEFNYLTFNNQDIQITDKGIIAYKALFKNLDIFSANIYNALEPADKHLNIAVYSTDGKRYRITQIQNTIVYLTFLESEQEKLINKLNSEDIKTDFNKKLKINFIDDISEAFLKVWLNTQYTPDDFRDNLYDNEYDTLLRLLSLPRGYSNCVKNIKKIKERILYPLFETFVNNMKVPDNITSVLNNKNTISKEELKIILLYRIFERKEDDFTIDDFIYKVEDSKALQKILSTDNHTIKEIINKYKGDFTNYMKMWKHISNLLTDFCKELIKE